jgi:uncharacterized protein (DUF488 family)
VLSTLFTIGFTQKGAERFFTLLTGAGVRRVLDVRLYNRTQLAGFSKGPDLEYFLRVIGGIGYEALPELAPSPELFTFIKKEGGAWDAYAARYVALLRERGVERSLERARFAGACLLCAEHEPRHCHRRLAAEYLRDAWGNLEIRHLT